MADPKKLMDMAANTAILGAFACGAPEVAALVGVTQFVIDLAWPDARTPTQCAPVDHAYLSAALDDLRSEITDAIWNGRLQTHTDLILHHSDTYWSYLKEFQQIDVNTDPKSNTKLNAYFTDDTSQEYPMKDLDVARLFLTDSDNDSGLTGLQVAEHYTNNIGLYALIGSTMITYLKTCVTWNRAKLMFPHLQYANYQAALTKWNNLTPHEQQMHPTWNPTPVADPNPNGKTPLMDWATWIKLEESGVPDLIETANILVAYAETGTPATARAAATKGMQVEMMEHWQQAVKNINSRLNLDIVPTYNRYYYANHFDTASGLDSYHDVDPGPIWVVDKQASFPFKSYTVASGDTLASVAGANGLMPEDVFFMNLPPDTNQFPLDFRNLKNDASYLQVGQVIRVPYHDYVAESRELTKLQWWFRIGALMAYQWEASMDKYALARVTEDDIKAFGATIQLWKRARASVQFTTYTAVAGDTLSTIAAAKYGDASLFTKIYDFNRDTVKNPNLVVAGQVINIPDKSVLSDL